MFSKRYTTTIAKKACTINTPDALQLSPFLFSL